MRRVKFLELEVRDLKLTVRELKTDISRKENPPRFKHGEVVRETGHTYIRGLPVLRRVQLRGTILSWYYKTDYDVFVTYKILLDDNSDVFERAETELEPVKNVSEKKVNHKKPQSFMAKHIEIMRTEDTPFIVHFDREGASTMTYWGKVYETRQIGSGGDATHEYVSFTWGPSKTYEKANDDCRILFEFMFCWRGCWEGRIQFPNEEEFWCEQLKEFSALWDIIEKRLKKIIIENNPDCDFN